MQTKLTPAYLALEDGSIFHGFACGARCDNIGETVFNTAMTGYQEIVSDPSYAGQFVTLTTSEVGNYGVCQEDMESRGLFLNGLIIQTMNEPSNYRSESSLEDFLKRNGVPALCGIDTRRLVLLLREKGALRGYMHCSESELSEADAVAKAAGWEGLIGQDYASKVTTPSAYDWSTMGALKVVAYDFGIKNMILRELAATGMQIHVVPASTSAKDVLALKPNGIFFSNGPADPSALKSVIAEMKQLVGKVPMMGICLGHQLLNLACGGTCMRLKFGHHGGNHPVKNLITGHVEITSQNHNFAVDPKSLPKHLEVTHINLNDKSIEGFRHTKEPIFAVQYHPEAAPGPHDSKYLFEQFRKMMER